MEKNDDVVVVTGYRKNSDNPIYVPKGEDKSDAVVLKLKDKKKKEGYHVDIPEGALSNIVLSNMAENIASYLLTKGFKMQDTDLKLLIASMTTRMIYIPSDSLPSWLKEVASYFTENVFYAEEENSISIVKCFYAACRNPERIHVLLLNLKKGFYFPPFLMKYINMPSSGVEMSVNEYINDAYIGKAVLPDNVFVFVTGDKDVISEEVERQYAVWNPKVGNTESHLAFYSVMGMNSIKNMYRVFEPVSDTLWNKMNVTEDILNAMGFKMSNKDSNHLDDYLVTLVNEGVDEDYAFTCMVKYRLIPMVRMLLDEKELMSKIHDAGLLKEGE